jgi:hypothetical protein
LEILLSYTNDEVELLLALIRRAATLDQASGVLAAKGLAHSASSWDELLEKRIRPGLATGALTVDDLLRLLRASEEYGRQHVFLYHCSPEKAQLLLETGRVREGLTRLGALSVLDKPRVVDLPSSLRIVDARWEVEETAAGETQSFILKLIEPRRYHTFLGEEERGGVITRRYQVETARAVHVAHLHADGLFELRVQSHRSSTLYEKDVDRLWKTIAPVFARREFGIFRIDKAKAALLRRKDELAHEVAYNDSMLRNDAGTVLTAATGKEAASLFDDRAAAASLEGFLQHGGYCDALNVRFLGEDAGGPPGLAKSLRVLFPAGLNELAITAQCSREDHRHVLARIRQLNR